MSSLPADLTAIYAHLVAAYPNEGCGLVIQSSLGAHRIRPMQNAYDLEHQRDPKAFPRTARTAYRFDSKEWLKVSQEMDDCGETLTCIFHSHADVGAYFSAEDKAMAAPDGEPLVPGVTYLVVAVDKGQVTDARVYGWDESRRDFLETRRLKSP